MLEAHAKTLGLSTDSPRLATARLGMSIVEGLASAGDDVARVVSLAEMGVPAEPQSLAKSMSSAGDVAGALRRHDWTTLDAVATAADAGDESARRAVAGLRTAAAAEELHSPLQSALAVAHQAATQWLLIRGGGSPGGGSGGTDGGAGGSTGGQDQGGTSGSGEGGTGRSGGARRRHHQPG